MGCLFSDKRINLDPESGLDKECYWHKPCKRTLLLKERRKKDCGLKRMRREIKCSKGNAIHKKARVHIPTNDLDACTNTV